MSRAIASLSILILTACMTTTIRPEEPAPPKDGDTRSEVYIARTR